MSAVLHSSLACVHVGLPLAFIRMWRMMVGAFLRVIVFRNLGDRYDLPLKKLPQGREAINRNQGHMQFRTTMMQKATERLGLPCE